MVIDFAKLAAMQDPAHPFGSPPDGRRVLSFLSEEMPVPTTGGMLQAFSAGGQPKTRGEIFLAAVKEGHLLDDCAPTVDLEPAEVNAAIAAGPAFARQVRIAQALGRKNAAGDLTASQRYRLVTTGGIDRVEIESDAGQDYMAMKAKLADLLLQEQGTGEAGPPRLADLAHG